MSRSAIVKALAAKFKEITVANGYQSDLYGNVATRMIFWDEVNDFPYLCMVAGSETRQYLPAQFKWGFLNISIKIYVRDEDPVERLEKLLEDIEQIIDRNQRLEYSPGQTTEEINIESIQTDEGVLNPMGVGDISIQVRYNVV